jgi:hypothetical protein
LVEYAKAGMTLDDFLNFLIKIMKRDFWIMSPTLIVIIITLSPALIPDHDNSSYSHLFSDFKKTKMETEVN